MPRVAKPWYRSASNSWYATKNGRKICLGVRGKKNGRQAFEAWHKMYASPKPSASASSATSAAVVKQVIDAFLADAEPRVSAECLRNYRKFLLPFSGRFGNRQADSMTTAEAESYARKPTWSASYRNGMLGSLLTAFKWAERAGIIESNPLRYLRKPPKASRGTQALVSAEQHKTLCDAADPFMRAFLSLLWLTGARPGEIAGLMAEEIDLEQGLAVLTTHKCAHLGKSRILFLNDEAIAILRERMAERPEGLLFPNPDGEVMTAQAIGCRLRRLCEKANVKHCIAYGYRHTFATKALSNGVPDAQVAALMGHSGTAMLHKHYSHLTSQSQALRDALAKVG